MIRVGIIGCGKIAQVRHIPEYAAKENVELAGFYDRTFSRAQEQASKYGGKAYETVEELLADETIDAVSICTANFLHAEHAVAALRAGKHVLLEKPMATTADECRTIIEAARESGKTLMIDQNQRLTGAHKKAKELILAGEIGEVLTFRTTFGHGGPETWSVNPGANTWFFDKKSSSLGAMADLGIHKTDLIQHLLGTYVVETMAKVTTIDKKDSEGNLIGVDDNVICIYTMANGVVGTMTASWTYYGQEDNTTIIYGTKGIMRIYDDPAVSLKVIYRDGTETDYRLEQIQTNDNQTASGVIDAFVDCLAEGTESPVSGESVMTAMNAVFASVESSETGRSIKVNR